MADASTCFWFHSDGHEAARFYASVIDGCRVLGDVDGPEGAPHVPDEIPLMTEFVIGEQRYQALNGGDYFTLDEAASISLSCETQEEADRYYRALSEGGSEQPCGWLKDRFGLSWQVVPRDAIALLSDPEVGPKAMEVMQTMTRIDVGAMRSAVGR